MYERKNCFNNYDSFNCFRFLASVTLKTLTEKEFMMVVDNIPQKYKTVTQTTQEEI